MDFALKKKISHGAWIVVAIMALSVAAHMSGLLRLPERKTIDLRMRLTRADRALPDEIAVVLIDEASLHAMDPLVGRWPWPRDIHAELISFFSLCGARSVIMDILFTEHQQDAPEADQRLVDETGAAGNVIYASQFVMDVADDYNPDTLGKPLPGDFVDRFALNVAGRAPYSAYNQCYTPFAELYAQAAGVGGVTFHPDSDGVFRSEAPVFAYDGNVYPSLGLSAALNYSGARVTSLSDGALVLGSGNDAVRIPLTDGGEYYINSYGQWPVFSYSGVIQTKFELDQGRTSDLPFDPSEFKDKIVFVGASAAAVEELKPTAFGMRLPGVLLHAAFLGNVLERDFLVFQGAARVYAAACILAALTVAAILLFKSMFLRTLLPVAFMAGYCGVALYLSEQNIVLNTAVPLFAVAAAFLGGFAYNMGTEGRERRRIRNILGQYVSPDMLKEVLAYHKDDYLRAEVGSKEVLTVFFSDIRGFTTISEQYAVELVVEMLNRYLSRMVAIIFQNQGTLDKFIGDAVVAFWGAPVKIADHAEKAVLSAIQMRKALRALNRENEREGLPEIKIGIGIHTGEVILGNIGSEKKLDYTVIGDSVNLTSRLEGLTKMYGCSILVTRDTYEQVKHTIVCRIVDYVKVKGKDTPIAIFEVMARRDDAEAEVLSVSELSDTAFNQYREGEFQSAIETLQSILAIRPDDFLAHLFIERCRAYCENAPPDNWDGCYAHKTK